MKHLRHRALPGRCRRPLDLLADWLPDPGELPGRDARASCPSPPAALDPGPRSTDTVATGSSLPSNDRTRGRLTATGRPPSVIDPSSWPWRLAVRSGRCSPFGPTTSATSASISSCTTPSPDTDAQREQSLSRGAHELAERVLNLRRERTLQRLSRADDLRSGHLLHRGSSCPLGLGLVAPNAPNRSGRGGRDRRSKFYEISGNLAFAGTPDCCLEHELQLRLITRGFRGRDLSLLRTGVEVTGPRLSVHHEREGGGCDARKGSAVPGRTCPGLCPPAVVAEAEPEGECR
jgi:hypothetical protein